MLNHKKIPKNNCMVIVLFIIASVIIATGLPLGLSIPHYAYAHSLPMTAIPAENSVVPKGAPLPSKIISQVSYLMSSYHLPNVLSRYSDIAVFCSSI